MPTSFNCGDSVRHVKTNTIYAILGRCIYEPSGEDCYYYYIGPSRVIWVRPVSEMEDGRFVRIEG